ncbi:MAG: outer membrane protein assembly factor BamA [Myxococcota bacterium]|nr:outer membrane protein assembly factor BamA [Myxococcota bacterium]
MRAHCCPGIPLALGLALLAAAVAAPAARAQQAPARVLVAVLPFEVHSERSLGYLESTLADLLTSRLESTGHVEVMDTVVVREALIEHVAGERTDEMLRRLAREVGADWVVEGSLTELAGSYSLDARVTPAGERVPTRTMVFTANSDEELLDRVNELADRALEIVSGEAGRGDVVEVLLVGLPEEEAAAARERLRTRPGTPYDSGAVREDLALLRGLPGVATATVTPERGPEGVTVTFRLLRTEGLLAAAEADEPEAADLVAEIRIVGNRRIEADAIRARIDTRPGDRFSSARVSQDVRQVHALGFFRNVRVLSEQTEDGRILTFEIEENPIVRQITIAGNDNLDADRIRDQLTLATGATLDVPLLFENRERIEALYRAEGYYLADVSYEIDPLPNDAVAVHFEVNEGGKLRLRQVRFEGNEHFEDEELSKGFRTKVWRWWSYVTKYLDKSGTYSEPVFMQDLQSVRKKYGDAGYLEAEVADPTTSTEENGLVVTVRIEEGDRYKVGKLDVSGDDTLAFGDVKNELALAQDEWFNRSHLSEDVDRLTSRFQDRGYYLASVSPAPNMDEDAKVVDVDFLIEKGPLYFVREIDVTGNTRTVDRVVRREMQLVEGQLYSARAERLSRARLGGLGFFEEVNLEPHQTNEPDQIDLEVRVVEKPTGSLSFGAGFSSQDSFVLSGSLSQNNLFGRAWGVRLSADFGANRNQFFATFNNRRLLDTEFGLSANIFRTELDFEDFDETNLGFDVTLSRSLDLAGRQRGFLRYSFTDREIDEDSNITASSVIFREFLNDNVTTSLASIAFRTDTRDDRVLPTSGYELGGSVDGAGIGGFSKFLRFEGRGAWYSRPPKWMPLSERSSVSLAARMGYVVPFNDIGDFDFQTPVIDKCLTPENCPLSQIDKDLELPLTERYFLGGLGTFQLRGYKGRSVGPRRAVLYETSLSGGLPGEERNRFSPVGRATVENPDYDPNDPDSPRFISICDDFFFDPINPENSDPRKQTAGNTQGNNNGKCNSLKDEDDGDFDDLNETDVVGGSQFISLSAEYRFPISEQLGLVGILFFDMGNAFAEDKILFDVTNWRFGTGAGVLWFSPFGPLQAFGGFPLNPLEVEDTFVFEFSVGGQSL